MLLTNERKIKEKSKNSARRRHWWSVESLNRTSFQNGGSTCNKSKIGWDMKFFLFSFYFCNFQPHKSTLDKMGKCFTTIMHIRWTCPNWVNGLRQFWTISLIPALLLAFMSHIRHSTKHFDTQRMQNIIIYIFLTLQCGLQTECKLYANAYLPAIFAKKLKVINAKRCSHCWQVNLVLFHFDGCQVPQRCLITNSLLHSDGSDEVSPGNLVRMIDRSARGRFWRTRHLCAKSLIILRARCFWNNRRLKMFCGWCHLHRMYTFTQDEFNSLFKSMWNQLEQGLMMRDFTWNRFPIKNLLIDSLPTPIVESTCLTTVKMSNDIKRKVIQVKTEKTQAIFTWSRICTKICSRSAWCYFCSVVYYLWSIVLGTLYVSYVCICARSVVRSVLYVIWARDSQKLWNQWEAVLQN